MCVCIYVKTIFPLLQRLFAIIGNRLIIFSSNKACDTLYSLHRKGHTSSRRNILWWSPGRDGARGNRKNYDSMNWPCVKFCLWFLQVNVVVSFINQSHVKIDCLGEMELGETGLLSCSNVLAEGQMLLPEVHLFFMSRWRATHWGFCMRNAGRY